MITPASTLRNAAYAGNLPVVRNLLLEGVDPNVADDHGRTALSHAPGNGHFAVVEALLTGGAWVDPHEDYDTHETPLIAAASNGHLDIVKKLVAAGANPSFHSGVSQRTAESYARAHGHGDISVYRANLHRP